MQILLFNVRIYCIIQMLYLLCYYKAILIIFDSFALPNSPLFPPYRKSTKMVSCHRTHLNKKLITRWHLELRQNTIKSMKTFRWWCNEISSNALLYREPIIHFQSLCQSQPTMAKRECYKPAHKWHTQTSAQDHPVRKRIQVIINNPPALSLTRFEYSPCASFERLMVRWLKNKYCSNRKCCWSCILKIALQQIM